MVNNYLTKAFVDAFVRDFSELLVAEIIEQGEIQYMSLADFFDLLGRETVPYQFNFRQANHIARPNGGYIVTLIEKDSWEFIETLIKEQHSG